VLRIDVANLSLNASMAVGHYTRLGFIDRLDYFQHRLRALHQETALLYHVAS